MGRKIGPARAYGINSPRKFPYFLNRSLVRGSHKRREYENVYPGCGDELRPHGPAECRNSGNSINVDLFCDRSVLVQAQLLHHKLGVEMLKHILAFFLATILVLGCGGGGGVPPIERNAFVVGDLPLQTPVHGRNAPIIDFDGSLHVGAGVAPEISQLGVTGARGEVSISSGSVRDGAGRAAVVEFMKQFHTFRPPDVFKSTGCSRSAGNQC